MNQTYTPKFQEEYSAKIPALTLLTSLGWTFLSPKQIMDYRGYKQDEVVLRPVLREELSKRSFMAGGKTCQLSEKALDNLISQVCSPALNEGLLKANERMYNHLLYGIAVTEFVDGKKVNPTIALIDWEHPENNQFYFTEEFTVLRSGGVETRRPDIVCFVNGIPLAVIEAKSPAGHSKKGPTIDEGISQSIRNQLNDEIPQLFAYSQILLSINGHDGRYGTCHTPMKFWAAWREEDITYAQMYALRNHKLSTEQIHALFDHRPSADLDWYQQLIAAGELAVSGQDKLLISLLSPERLLEMTRFFTLFDKKTGKIVARYQQVFGIKRLLERISTRRPDGGREGGVIWHTTGSGKSYTMVFLSKALILHDSLKRCRIVVVTDRIDLEEQLSSTFASGGELAGKKDKANAMATSGQMLAKQIGSGKERIIFTLIQKFNSATKLPECVNTSPDIIVLIDEGHRSQGGENHVRMKLALPNAAFVAFTGTPLLKEDKTTNKFGPIVHAYTMQRAVEDKAVTPLLYEERIPDLEVNDRAIDAWFDRITDGLSEAQKADLKRKYARKGEVYSADDRIRLIALDIATHFSKNIDEGLKGQLACDSKISAIKYKKYLDEAGLFESAVVISPPDTREGNTEVDESKLPEVTKWWKDNVGTQDESVYTRNIISRFDTDEKLKLLIVVDKLLTGFDEPKNTVLYIDKPLKSHNLIQAIARVNRLHPLKKFGLLIDYRGILAELDTTIGKYQDLASRTQGGYDIKDIDGLYSAMSSEYKRLPHLYNQLWAIFAGVKNKNDTEQLRAVLVPKMEERDGEMVDIHQKTRDDFFEALTAFAGCLKVALQSATFFTDKSFTEQDRNLYKETVKQMSSLRQWAMQVSGEQVNYDDYAEQVKKLLDKHVTGVEVREPDGVYEVGKMGKSEKPEEWDNNKTRNETDIIKTRVTKMIEQELRDDPYAQEAFSKLLRMAIEEAEKLFDHPLKQYLLFREFEEQVEARKLSDIPDALAVNKHAQAYYGVFKKELPEVFAVNDVQVQDKWTKLAFEVDNIIVKAVAENSLNPQDIEKVVKTSLLPLLFTACREIGAGMNQVNRIVETIIQILRVGLMKS
ncbi:TPA: type I restriction endonuclease subunit R [Klebsiella pneumoniae]|mgnify:FL=1|uniref:type I restriction endonuclease subunit R n=1 Tax=Klebsiella pneumoniae complex TaxID=3390273 RepID=UPI000A0F2AD5|nr:MULTISPECIES: type I restriction endonuclease subunit R [Klebsiella]HDL3841393.1 type I restriction endonuclease subunit R [Escherichia coli]HDT3776540.1 type I restriction endonuclease subunit R [Klebsiella pneumoniae subsp. pneumoniae]MBE8771679.1 type I restriction endonuclease subunit R [Klebsiella quasipneumoniae]MBZ1630346.1 type I restriction endonuclease subunit R [Klebsiella pneumoniae]MCQ8605160.1 type I restriction endonuclease subunit R [Klebsiella pneumoniae]